MIRRLVEAHYLQYRKKPVPEQIDFWFKELRTPSFLIELAGKYPVRLPALKKQRFLLQLASTGDAKGLRKAFEDEERQERETDRNYWLPLISELEQMRHNSRRQL